MTTAVIPESNNYIESSADSILTVGTNVNGDDLITFVFLNNYPVVVSDENQALSVTGVEKRRVASISVSNGQAKRFYESLKDIFEPQA